jgi:hypothetical protein
MPTPALEREFNRRALVANCLLGSLQRVVANGPLLQLISISQFALTDGQYAGITAVFATATLAQLLGLLTQYRYGVYGTLISSYRMRTVLLAVMAVVPLVASKGSLGGAIGFFLCAYLVCACHAAGFNVCWPAIVRAGTDAKTRGRVTAKLRTTQVALAAAMVLVITLVGPPALSGLPFSALLMLFAVYSFTAGRQVEWMQAFIEIPPVTEVNSVLRRLRQDMRHLFGQSSYRRFMILLVLFGLCVFPIQIYFLRDVVGLRTQQLFWYSAALTWVGILSIQAWGKAIDRFSAWVTLRYATLAVFAAFATLLIAMLSAPSGAQPMPGGLQVVVVTALLAISIATQGVGLLWFNCALDVVPSEATTLGVLLLSLASELATVFGALLVTLLRGYALEGVPFKEVLIICLWVTIAGVAMRVTHSWAPTMAQARV